MEKAYAAWRAFQDRFLAHAGAILLLGCTLLALLEVLRRYVFGHSFEWQQDAVTFITLSGVFLYFGITQRRDAHLSVTLVTDSLQAMGPRARVHTASSTSCDANPSAGSSQLSCVRLQTIGTSPLGAILRLAEGARNGKRPGDVAEAFVVQIKEGAGTRNRRCQYITVAI